MGGGYAKEMLTARQRCFAARPHPPPFSISRRRTGMKIIDDNGRWQGAVANCLSARFEGNRQERKKHARLRDRSGSALRAQSVAIRQVAREEQKAATLMRRLKKHLGLLDEHQVWGRGIQIRATKLAPSRCNAKAKKVMAGSPRPLPAYHKPLADKRGRIALYMAISYVGLRSAKWRSGLPAEHVYYISRADAVEIAAMAGGTISNMGESTGEIAQAWQALEEVEKAYRANAIVQHRIVVNLPHALSPVGRERVLTQFCKRSFGRYGLPYVAVPHLPDPGGNSRNFHGHICISARPMQRTGDHEWAIGEEKISGFTDPDSLKRIRAEFAAVLNRECRREGLEVRFTHQNYKERGIDAKRQEHYGPERTALHRNGEAVDMVGRNQARVKRNETKATLAVVNMAAEATTKFEELARRRLALLDRRKMLHRRLKVVDGILTLVDDVSRTSRIRPQQPSASLEAITTKRLAVTDLDLRLGQLDAGSGLNDRRPIDASHGHKKSATLARIDQRLAMLVAKASSPYSVMQTRFGALARRGPKRFALSTNLAALRTRVESIIGWSARVAAIKASAGQLFRETKSIPRETILIPVAPVGNVDLTHPSTSIDGAKQSARNNQISTSFALENAKAAPIADLHDVQPSTMNGDEGKPASVPDSYVGSWADAANAANGSSTVKPSFEQRSQTGSGSSAPDHDEKHSSIKISRDAASLDELADAAPAIEDDESAVTPPPNEIEGREPKEHYQSQPDTAVQRVEQAPADGKDEAASEPCVADLSRSIAGPSGNDEASPFARDDRAKDDAATVPAPAIAAPALPPADEHDLLIGRFETARSDEERRKSAAAIRADKIALARMTQRDNPQWVAIDDQFRTQQRIAAMKGGGIGG